MTKSPYTPEFRAMVSQEYLDGAGHIIFWQINSKSAVNHEENVDSSTPARYLRRNLKNKEWNNPSPGVNTAMIKNQQKDFGESKIRNASDVRDN